MTSSRVRSAERALDVLELLARRGSLSARSISEFLEFPKSTTHHLLNVMGERGFLAYSTERRIWSLGVATHEVGSAFLREGHMQQLGMRHLRRLTEGFQVVSHLAQLHGTDVLYLDKQEPPTSGVRLVTEVGTRLPAHLTAVGRASLSTLEPAELEELYRDYAWPQRTGEGPLSFEELARVLADVRTEGVAVEEGATTSGIRCVAAPLVSHAGACISLGVAFLGGTKSEQDAAAIRDAVREEAHAFSASLDR